MASSPSDASPTIFKRELRPMLTGPIACVFLTRESDAEIVAGAWDFERINRRYARHLKILGERPGGALRNDTTAKALLRWAATER